jgi:release factor glutamine methyltransferase
VSTPLKLLEILNRTSEFFAQHGIDTPRVDAEWILAHVLGLRRLELYLRFDQPMAETELSRLRPLVARRARREPLAYVLGQTNFCDLTLRVDSRVLIPRPETELLVEHILSAHPQPERVLDIGTGSGAIALVIAQARPLSTVTATDLSPDALVLARENASLNGLVANFILADLFPPRGERFDLIVSNPPYVREDEYPGLQPEIVGFEPKMALTAPENGLQCYRRILEGAADYLSPTGSLWFEIGHDQAMAVFALGERNGWRHDRLIHDYNGFERVVSLLRA